MTKDVRLHAFLAGILLMSPLFAFDVLQSPKIVAFSIGPAWYSAGETQTIYLQPNFANTYAAQKPTQTLVSGELFLGLGYPVSGRGLGEIGLALAATNSAQLQGQILETGDPLFNNYSYQYRIKHEHIAAKGKWLFSNWSSLVSPYCSASLGVARNTSYHFTQAPLIQEALNTPGFTNKSITAFTYTFSAGIEKSLTPNWLLGIGYELGAWGESELGRTATQTINSGLTLSNLYTQQLEFTLTYLL